MPRNDNQEFKRLLDIQLHGTPEEAIRALRAERTRANKETVDKLILVLQSERDGESIEHFAQRKELK